MSEAATIVLVIMLTAAVAETALFILIKQLRKNFQWIITAKDELPDFPPDLLKRFLEHSFDPELGWVRKANTQAQESGGTAGEAAGHYKKSAYHIDGKGARLNPGYDDSPAIISTYGDSFVFSRQVEDTETWQHFLSQLTDSNILNFGVGNFGVDQALLRLKREYAKNRTPIVIIGVVPETIVRILCVWKHYSEYGNILAFKPRFEWINGELTCINNVIDGEEKFAKLKQYLPHLRRHDFFYTRKFCKDILRFPYLISLLRSRRRNIPLLASLVARKVRETAGMADPEKSRPWKMILERNFEMVRDLYQTPSAVDLFLKILDNYAAWGREKGFHPVFLLMPYRHDLLYTREHGCYYGDFVVRARNILHTIDLTDGLLLAPNLDELFSNDFYGGHLSKRGNQCIAAMIDKELADLM